MNGLIPAEVCPDLLPHNGEWKTVSQFLINGEWSRSLLENDGLEDFYDAIASVPVGESQEEDSIVWSGTPTGAFSLKSAWELIRIHHERWPWVRLVWHPVIPKTYSLLCWRILWHRLPTLDHVKRYYPEIAQNCCFCITNSETVDHLFLECVFTREIWRSCCEALHLAFDPEDITLAMVVLRLPQTLGSTHGGVLARLTLLTWIFSIWEERNARIFYCKSRRRNQVVAQIACRVRDIWEAHKLGNDELWELLIAWRLSANMDLFEPP